MSHSNTHITAMSVAAAVALACTGALAQGTSTKTDASTYGSTTATAFGPEDRAFLKQAAMAGTEEVSLGTLAERKAQDHDVQAFAKRMVDDHGQANDELKQIASRDGLTIPSEPDANAQREKDRLEKLSGAKFDAQYMKHQASDHQKVIAEFRKEAREGKNADLKQFAEKTLPTLEGHLQLARSADKAARNESGLKAAQDGTGATSVAAERTDRMPVPKTGR